LPIDFDLIFDPCSFEALYLGRRAHFYTRETVV
jgi:hypothetical protein